jgi:hypothetical protein
MRALASTLLVFFGFVGWSPAADKEKQPAKPGGAPRSVPEEGPVPMPLPTGWVFDPDKDEWRDPEGTHWRFDGLRWRVLWTDKHWYPVIPPGPLPLWQHEDLGKGWSQILPPGSSTWHIVPPTPYHMPPPFMEPPLPYAYGAAYRGPQGGGLFRRRWR